MHRIGPNCWKAFNAIIQRYEPIDDIIKTDTQNMFFEIGQHFPCSGCRRHYQEYVKNTNWENVLSSRDTLIKFITDLHNSVNIRLGRPPISNSDARDVILNDTPPTINQLALTLPVRLFYVLKNYNDIYHFTCN